MPVPVSSSAMTMFVPLQAQPTLSFGGTHFVAWSGRTVDGQPYAAGIDTDVYDTYSDSTGDICIPDNAGVISVPLGAIYPRFPIGLGGYSTFPLHPLLGRGIAPHQAVYAYVVSCRYDIVAYADPDPNEVSATAVTDFDVVTNGLLEFTLPKCGYQDSYQNEPFEGGVLRSILNINVHGVGKFFPKYGPTANKNRFKVRFYTPVCMNFPGFTNSAIQQTYELNFRIIGTTPVPTFWQDYGTIAFGHVRGHAGFSTQIDGLTAGVVDLHPTMIQVGFAGYSSAYNEKVARLTLPFDSTVRQIHPNGYNLVTERSTLVHPDLAGDPSSPKRFLGMELEFDVSDGFYTKYQTYTTNVPALPSGVPIPYDLLVPDVPTSGVAITYQGLYSGIPTISFAYKNGPPFQYEIAHQFFWAPNPQVPPTLGGDGSTPVSGTCAITGHVSAMLVAYHETLPFVSSAGTGYEVGDVVHLSDGSASEDCEITVTSVDVSGGVTDAQITKCGKYSTLPTGSLVAGGNGSGLALNIRYGVAEVTIDSLDPAAVWGADIIFNDSGTAVWYPPAGYNFNGATAYFNPPDYSQSTSSITVSRYSSALDELVSSPRYNRGLPTIVTSETETDLDFIGTIDGWFFDPHYGTANAPFPQNSRAYLFDVTPSGLGMMVPLWSVGSLTPLHNYATNSVRCIKTNEYTVSDFLDDFAILSGVAEPEFGRHKAVAFDATGLRFNPYEAGDTPDLYRDADGTVEFTELASVTVTNGGSGYTSAPTVLNDADGATGLIAVLEPTSVASVTIDDPGSLTDIPAVIFSGGGGSGVAAHATLVPTTLDRITLTKKGSGYTSIPNVSISGGGGVGAAGSATLLATAVESVVINDAGRGYTAIPTVSFSPSGATATAYLKMVPQLAPNPAVIIASAGSGYTAGDLLYIGAGSPDLVSPAIIQVDTVDGSGGVMTASIHTAGVWSINPGANPISSNQGGSGSGATFNVKWGVNSVSGPNQGNYFNVAGEFGGSYQDIPSVIFTGTCDVPAVATAELKCTSIQSVSLTNPGSGFTDRPSVTISGGGGSQAEAVAFLSATELDDIILDSGGSGYTSAPTVAFDAYGIGYASATAVLSPRAVERIDIGTADGATATLHFSGGGGSGVAAICNFETAAIDETNTGIYDSGVALWQWQAPPSGVPIVFYADNGEEYPDSFANPSESTGTPSELNETVNGGMISASYYGIVGWYPGISQSEIDERITYKWSQRGIIGSRNTWINQEYPTKVYATIITYAWRSAINWGFFGIYPNGGPSDRELSRRTVDITETDSYIVEPPGPGPDGEGGFCVVQFEYVCDGIAVPAPGHSTYP